MILKHAFVVLITILTILFFPKLLPKKLENTELLIFACIPEPLSGMPVARNELPTTLSMTWFLDRIWLYS